jgi:hypothetical protein
MALRRTLMPQRLSRMLVRHDLPALLAAAAVLLTLPALWTGWQFDDYLHRQLLLARPGLAGLAPATMGLFSFLTGDPAATMAHVERGDLAWWTLPEARQAFWRPLSGLSHWLDYQLWPGRPALMHLHSLAWLAGLAGATALLYRRLMGPVVAAGLAATLYALDDARGFAAAWLANRNALCAALFAVLALLAHLRWRETGAPRALVAALLGLGCALLAGEAAVATLAYLAAYALWIERGPWRRRLIGLAPALGLVVLWRAAYSAMGYGAQGTAYLDPLGEPLRYALVALQRGPLLLLGQWTPLPAELSPFLAPRAAALLWLGAVAGLVALAAALAPLLRADRLARFWATGMLLALIPACAALPANRLLFFVGLGSMGLLARFVCVSADGVGGPLRRASAGALLATHLLLGPLALPLAAYSPALLGGAEAALATLPGDPAVTQRDIVVVTAPSVFSLSAIGPLRAASGVPAPARTLLLAAGLGGAWVERPDAHTLVVRPAGGYLLGFDSVFRAPWRPLAEGAAVRLTHVTVSVSELTPDGRPAVARFRFATPLEDARRQWFVYRHGAYVPWTPPPIGGLIWVAPLVTWPGQFYISLSSRGWENQAKAEFHQAHSICGWRKCAF